MLQNMSDSSYGCITPQIGGNDCSISRDIDDILSSYDELITEALRVSQKVCISSICPRTRNQTEDTKIRSVNGRLNQIAAKRGLDFIDNDGNFRFQNGTVDMTTLQSDGVHLTSTGVNRLISNMGLAEKVRFLKLGSSKNPGNSSATNRMGFKWDTPVTHYTKQHHNHPAFVPAELTVPIQSQHQPLSATQQQPLLSAVSVPQKHVLPNLCVPPPGIRPSASLNSINNQGFSRSLNQCSPADTTLNVSSLESKERRPNVGVYKSVAGHVYSRDNKPNDMGKISCFNCGVQGHIRRNCKLPSPVNCYTCGNIGHKSVNCALNQCSNKTP